jgi:(p)ppGpp synthase/HD superfamily hydrolase
MDKAKDFVRKSHEGQEYKGGVPYWLHLNRVAKLLEFLFEELNEGESKSNEKIVVGAYLHDILEDTEVSESEICNNFGSEVLEIVKELTDKNSEERESSEYTLRMVNASEEARLIKLGDLYDNLTTAAKRLNENGFEWTSGFFVPRIDSMCDAMLEASFEKYPKTSETLKKMVKISKKLLLDELRYWKK